MTYKDVKDVIVNKQLHSLLRNKKKTEVSNYCGKSSLYNILPCNII
jgi:hypothetical protein